MIFFNITLNQLRAKLARKVTVWLRWPVKFVLNWFGGKISLVNAVMVSGHWLSVWWCVCVVHTKTVCFCWAEAFDTLLVGDTWGDTFHTVSKLPCHTRWKTQERSALLCLVVFFAWDCSCIAIGKYRKHVRVILDHLSGMPQELYKIWISWLSFSIIWKTSGSAFINQTWSENADWFDISDPRTLWR